LRQVAANKTALRRRRLCRGEESDVAAKNSMTPQRDLPLRRREQRCGEDDPDAATRLNIAAKNLASRRRIPHCGENLRVAAKSPATPQRRSTLRRII
jgi:hypothetical protein